MGKNFQKFLKAMNPQIQEAQKTSSTQNIKEHYTKAYMIKLLMSERETVQLAGRLLVP